MKYFSKESSQSEEIVKKDYAKTILLDHDDFGNDGHLLQIVTIPPHTKQRSHKHFIQTEVFYILEGECLMFFNEEEFLAKPGDAFICEPGDSHYLWNKNDEDFKLAVFKIDLPQGDDTEWKD